MHAGLFDPDSEAATLTPFFLLFALALDIHPMGLLLSLNVCEATFLMSHGIQLNSFGTAPDPTSDNVTLQETTKQAPPTWGQMGSVCPVLVAAW